MIKLFLSAFLLLGFVSNSIGCLDSNNSNQPLISPVNDEISGQVVGVTDGDTVKVLTSDKTLYKIRLEGIDAPESKQDFGQASKKNLSNLIFQKNVTVITSKKDRYGRYIGKILYDGVDVNLAQVKIGLAWHYKRYQKEQTATDRKLYAEAEIYARNNKIGLWSMPDPVAPWNYRRGKK